MSRSLLELAAMHLVVKSLRNFLLVIFKKFKTSGPRCLRPAAVMGVDDWVDRGTCPPLFEEFFCMILPPIL